MEWPHAAVVLVGIAVLAVAQPVGAQESIDESSCVEGRRLQSVNQLEKARDAFLDGLAEDEASACAARGLATVRTAQQQETKLCAEGAALAK